MQIKKLFENQFGAGRYRFFVLPVAYYFSGAWD